MTDRTETRREALSALKRLQAKGIRSVYLEGATAGTSPSDPAIELPPPRVAAEPPRASADLAALAKTVSVCTRCALHQSRKQTVFGVGNPHAKLLFIGEAPG